MDPSSDLIVEEVPFAHRATAVKFLLQSPVTGGLLHEASSTEDHLIWARDSGGILAATWLQAATPGIVTVVPPRLAERAPRQLGRSLFKRVEDLLFSSAENRIAQALSDLDDRVIASLLSEFGFERLSDINFMSATAQPLNEPCRVALELVGSKDRIGFAKLLGQAYDDTADCPVLEGWRNSAGLSQLPLVETGPACDDCYYVQYRQERIGGVVLNRDPSATDTLDIRYLGICRTKRQRGFGREVLSCIRNLAAREGRNVIAAVDGANVAAYQTYQSAGFLTWHQRRLWGRQLFSPPRE